MESLWCQLQLFPLSYYNRPGFFCTYSSHANNDFKTLQKFIYQLESMHLRTVNCNQKKIQYSILQRLLQKLQW